MWSAGSSIGHVKLHVTLCGDLPLMTSTRSQLQFCCAPRLRCYNLYCYLYQPVTLRIWLLYLLCMRNKMIIFNDSTCITSDFIAEPSGVNSIELHTPSPHDSHANIGSRFDWIMPYFPILASSFYITAGRKSTLAVEQYTNKRSVISDGSLLNGYEDARR